MNREIKFRGLRKDKHETQEAWKYGNLLNSDSIGEVGANLDSYTYAEVIPESVGQYTGLKDKNGKEIYEGDIVTGNTSYERSSDEAEWTKEKPCVVLWSDRCAGFYPFIMNNRWRCDVENIEVIGNIHENPDLLK